MGAWRHRTDTYGDDAPPTAETSARGCSYGDWRVIVGCTNRAGNAETAFSCTLSSKRLRSDRVWANTTATFCIGHQRTGDWSDLQMSLELTHDESRAETERARTKPMPRVS